MLSNVNLPLRLSRQWLREQLETHLPDPIFIPEPHPTWVYLRPERLVVSDLKQAGEEVEWNVGVDIGMNVFIGGSVAEAPGVAEESRIQKLDVPRIESGGVPEESLVQLPVLLSYGFISNMIQAEMVKQSIEVGGSSFDFARIKMEERGPFLRAEVAMEGSFKLLVEADCLPKLNVEDQCLQIEVADIRWKEAPFLIRSLGTLAEKTIRRKISESSSKPLRPIIEEVRGNILKEIKKLELPFGLRLDLDLQDLRVMDLSTRSYGIHVVIEGKARGQLLT